MKLKWRVSEKPTGPYRSFHQRGWPSAYLPGDRIAFHLTCETEYIPTLVREGKHAAIGIRVARWFERGGGQTPTFEWMRYSKSAASLDEAKVMCQKFLDAWPEYFLL